MCYDNSYTYVKIFSREKYTYDEIQKRRKMGEVPPEPILCSPPDAKGVIHALFACIREPSPGLYVFERYTIKNEIKNINYMIIY